MRVHRIRDRATTRGMLRALDTILIISLLYSLYSAWDRAAAT